MGRSQLLMLMLMLWLMPMPMLLCMDTPMDPPIPMPTLDTPPTLPTMDTVPSVAITRFPMPTTTMATWALARGQLMLMLRLMPIVMDITTDTGGPIRLTAMDTDTDTDTTTEQQPETRKSSMANFSPLNMY